MVPRTEVDYSCLGQPTLQQIWTEPDILFDSTAMKRPSEISLLMQQRININFCVKLGWTFTRIKAALKQCYHRTMCNSSIHFWIKEFSDGRDSIVDKPRSARTKSGRSVANVRAVENLVAEDRRVTIKQMSVSSGLATTTIQRILKHDLGLTKKCAKFIPYDLTDHHKECRRQICNFMTRMMANSPRVFQTVVTMDESWVYVYDPETKLQSKEWLRKGEPRPQKPRQTLATGKVMVVTFFDARGMVYFEFVQRPLTINQEVFRAIFRRFDAAHGPQKAKFTGEWAQICTHGQCPGLDSGFDS